LNETPVPSLAEAREKTRAWQLDHDCHRPHSGLGNLPTAEFTAKGFDA